METKSVTDILAKLSLKQKASLCSGYGFWNTQPIPLQNLPSIMMTDGPHGLRKQESEQGVKLGVGGSRKSTCFPPAVTTSNSFDPELLKEIGVALGEEAIDQDVSILLGPAMNIKRSPLCGRNFEYVSEDPLVAGELAGSLVAGMESKGIAACIKHFAANNQEKARFVSDMIIDERALREIYLSGFERAVKKGNPGTVMCSYNLINGAYSCENRWLLTKVLREEWGFKGLVMTDWAAINNRVDALAAGLELEMPSSRGQHDVEIVEAVESGKLPLAILDQAVTRILTMILRGLAKPKPTSAPYRAHQALARRAFEESAVLLKNDKLLPIQAGSSVALLGAFAKETRYQGSGSSHIEPTNLMHAYEGFAGTNPNFVYEPAYSLTSDDLDEEQFNRAVSAAKGKDCVVIFAGLPDRYESEGFDREHMALPPVQNKLISEVAKVNSNVVVVLYVGAPVEMPWIDQVKSVLLAYLPGQEGAGAIADMLYGKVVPCGKLAETFPVKLSDTPAYLNFGGTRQVQYRESIFVGYRYYERARIQVLFPFGHGLSYTNFKYSNLELDKTSMKDDEVLTVSVDVTNTGDYDGKEIVELYVSAPISPVFRPKQELRAFKKVFIHQGETVKVTMTLDKRAFAYYNTNISDWHVESGNYSIRVGASSSDIRLKASVTVQSSIPEAQLPDFKEKAPHYYALDAQTKIFDEAQFEAVYGKKIPAPVVQKKGCFDCNATLADMKDGLIGKLLLSKLRGQQKKMYKEDRREDQVRMFESMIDDMPLRAMCILSPAMMTVKEMDAYILMANGHFFKGIFAMNKARKWKKDMNLGM